MMTNLVKRGYKSKETLGVTLWEYEMEMVAEWKVDEERLSLHRDLLATFMNFGGMGLKKPVTAKELMYLHTIDNIDNDELNTLTKAKELIKYIASN